MKETEALEFRKKQRGGSFKQEMRRRDHFCSVDGNVKRRMVLGLKNQAKKEHRVDALAPYAEEGRG